MYKCFKIKQLNLLLILFIFFFMNDHSRYHVISLNIHWYLFYCGNVKFRCKKSFYFIWFEKKMKKELEKSASRKLRINAKETMAIAEKLYTQGFISYPRTETNQFPKDFNLTELIDKQTGDSSWGGNFFFFIFFY